MIFTFSLSFSLFSPVSEPFFFGYTRLHIRCMSLTKFANGLFRQSSMTESSPSPPLFEESLLQLEKIVRQLEDGKTSLEDALKQYEEGVQLLRHCHVFLNQAQRQIEILRGVAEDGTPILEPVAEESVRTAISAFKK